MLKGTQANRIANSNPKLYHLKDWDRHNDPKKLEIISEIIQSEGRDPSIAELTVKILKSARIVPRDYKGQAAALLKWVQENIYYVNEPGERLQSPKYTLRRGFGDCDDMVIVLCSFYESIGLPWKLVLSGNNRGKKVRYIQGDKYKPGTSWAHIYAMVGNQPFHPNQWYFAEPTIKNVPLGWDVVASNSNELPELLSPQYAGYGVPSKPMSFISVGAGVSAGESYSHNRDHHSFLLSTKVKEIVLTVVVGTATAVASEIVLEYVREKIEEMKRK
jgi:hypothetical protein